MSYEMKRLAGVSKSWVLDYLPTGPKIPASEAQEIVVSLRQTAADAVPLVAKATGLPEATGEVEVLTRSGLVQANLDMVQKMMHPEAPFSRNALSAVLAFLSQRILGQYNPIDQVLYLNAQTIVSMERRLDLEPRDFRLWIALHEQTHRAQFQAAPWLVTQIKELMFTATSPAGSKDRALIKELIEKASGFMSFLEGHADVMMDQIELPTTKKMRQKLEEQRRHRDFFTIFGKCLGLQRKMAQYAEGAEFCRTVIDHFDVKLLNRAFESPEAMPTLAEIREPRLWISRIR